MADNFFTLVYNDEKIRILYKKGGKLISYGEALLPPQTVNQGKITRPRVFAQTLNDLKRKAIGRPITLNSLVAALPEEKVFIQVVEIPEVPEEKILETIKWQADKLISFPLENVYLDAAKIALKEKKLKVLLTASPKEIVNSLVEAIRLAGLTLLSCDSRSGALARLISQTPHELSFIVDIVSEKQATLIIAKNSFARLSTVVDFGGDLKLLGEKIKETAKFYLSRKEPEKEITKLYLVGAEEATEYKGLAETSNLKIKPVSFSQIFPQRPAHRELNQYIANFGLYMNLDQGVNLLPEGVKKEISKQETIKEVSNLLNWLLLATSLLIFIAVLVWGGLTLAQTKIAALVSSEKKIQASPTLKTLENKVTTLNQRLSQMKGLQGKTSTTNSLFEAIKTAMPLGGKITEAKYDITAKTLTIFGILPDRAKIVEYGEALSRVEGVKEVKVPLKNFEIATDILFEINLTLP